MTPATTAKTAAAAPRELIKELNGVDWLQLAETWGLKLLAAVVIFLVGRWLARRLSVGLDRVMGRAGVDVTLGGFLRNIAYAVMLVLVLMTALTALGVPTTSMFAILGAAGLAVGLALKDSLSNIASGVMLIVLRPFRAGDHVVAAGQEGTVLEIRVFQTRLRAFDHRVVILPDKGLRAHASAAEWDGVIAKMTPQLAAGATGAAVIAGLDAAGDLLGGRALGRGAANLFADAPVVDRGTS